MPGSGTCLAMDDLGVESSMARGIGYWIVKTKSSSVQSDCSLVSDEKTK